MATLSAITTNGIPPLLKPSAKSHNPIFSPVLISTQLFSKQNPSNNWSFSTQTRKNWVIWSVMDDKEVVPLKNTHSVDQESRLLLNGSQEFEHLPTSSTSSSSSSSSVKEEDDDLGRLKSRAINAAIVLGFGTFAVTKLLTIDHDYWHGWTLYEILRYVPEHNWIAYEEALKTNPVLAKMMISGVVYALGDWIAQCFEGKPLFEFDRTRMFRSGLVGFTLHGSLSHYYYQFCEALIPFQDWWVVPAKVAFDQTVWSAVWNSIYFVALGLLRFESPTNIFKELKATFLPMLTVRNSSSTSFEF